MANDRMWIENKITGKKLGLAKHYCAGWFSTGDITREELDEFWNSNGDTFFEDPHAYIIGYEDSDTKDKSKCFIECRRSMCDSNSLCAECQDNCELVVKCSRHL